MQTANKTNGQFFKVFFLQNLTLGSLKTSFPFTRLIGFFCTKHHIKPFFNIISRSSMQVIATLDVI